MTDAERKAQREKWEDKNCTKKITCPEHPLANHKATLFCIGHRFAGTWECPKGFEEDHDHYAAIDAGLAELEIEEGETPDSPDRNDGYTFRYYLCGGEEGCGVQLEGDPDADAAEARADAEADNWRDE